MFFNSLEFGVFFVAVFSVYCGLSHRLQNRWLLVASYTFYAAWDWRFLSLIIFSTVVDYSVGIWVSESEDPRRRRLLVSLSVLTNLGILGAFKYAGFFAESLVALMKAWGLSVSFTTLEIVLPVGISFYTFQTLSYTIDIYRQRIKPTHNFLDFALFVAFFPQLVAGPIERASRLLPQIEQPRKIELENIRAGAWLILWGLFKKVVVGDNIGGLVNGVYAPGATPYAPEILLGTYAFAVQIYCDFSGYTDIARGIGRILGFDFMLNFRLPYLAPNPSEFWHRWHISLSTWLRDYLYISLGGNRHGSFRTYRNLMLTMLLGGLWHGAAWNFIVWGAFHGALLAGHRALSGVFARLVPSTPVSKSPVSKWLWGAAARVFTFHLVCFGWLLFRVESLGQAGDLLTRMFGSWQAGLVPEWILPFTVLTAPLAVMQLWQAKTGDLEVVRRCPIPVRATIYAALVLGIIVFGEDFGQPFIYFQF